MEHPSSRMPRLLLIASGLTAAATLLARQVPPAPEQLEFVAILLDLVPFGGTIGATAVAARRLNHESRSRSQLQTGIYAYFAGGLVATLGVAHLVAVLLAALDRSRVSGFVYDFRFYSLIQLGALLVAGGLIAAALAVRLATGQSAAWRASVLVWATILVMNVALLPLQGFAVLFSVLAAIAILLHVSLRKHWPKSRSTLLA